MNTLREWIKQNPKVISGAASVMLLAALIYFLSGGAEPASGAPIGVWYYDPVEDSYFPDKPEKMSPLTSPNGNEAYRTHINTCGNCTEEERFISYYEKFTPEALAALARNPLDIQARREGRMVSADAQNWIPAISAKGQKLTNSFLTRCDGKLAESCMPY